MHTAATHAASRNALLSLALLAPVCALRRAAPPGAQPGRRAVLQQSAAAAASLLAPGLAGAFDVPPLDAYDDPKAKLAFEGKANPPLTKQASSAFYAITTNDDTGLRRMIESGWDLSAASDSAGKTAMHRAAQVGNTGAIQLMLDAGVKPSVANKFDETPLHMAVRNGRLPAVKLLVGAGADLGAKTFGGDTALSLAAKYRMKPIEEYLSSL